MPNLEHYRSIAAQCALDPRFASIARQIRSAVRHVELLDRYAAELVVLSLPGPLSDQQREDLAALQRLREIVLETLQWIVDRIDADTLLGEVLNPNAYNQADRSARGPYR